MLKICETYGGKYYVVFNSLKSYLVLYNSDVNDANMLPICWYR